ncbi:MAG TPA: hypothetical protein VFD39_05315 [Trueperaceae bacterium]|nr:hypothetical protein [Trueperaceae bacterium]
MMASRNRSWVAALMVAVGMLFLIDRFAWAAGISNLLWSLVFFAAAAALVWLYVGDTSRWWALFPGFAALAVALAILAGSTGGLVLLALSGAIFLTLYVTDRGRRWALLVGGALMSLALMAFFETVFTPADNGWWLFFGLALTFLALYLRRPAGAGSWNLFAAIALGAMALLALFTGRIVETLIALMLLAGGAFMLWREASHGAAARSYAEPTLPNPLTTPPAGDEFGPAAPEAGAQPANSRARARSRSGPRSSG